MAGWGKSGLRSGQLRVPQSFGGRRVGEQGMGGTDCAFELWALAGNAGQEAELPAGSE